MVLFALDDHYWLFLPTLITYYYYNLLFIPVLIILWENTSWVVHPFTMFVLWSIAALTHAIDRAGLSYKMVNVYAPSSVTQMRYF